MNVLVSDVPQTICNAIALSKTMARAHGHRDAKDASVATDTNSASGEEQRSSDVAQWAEESEGMRLTVVAGAAASHALGRCSGVVLHFDDVYVLFGGDVVICGGDVRCRFWRGEASSR